MMTKEDLIEWLALVGACTNVQQRIRRKNTRNLATIFKYVANTQPAWVGWVTDHLKPPLCWDRKMPHKRGVETLDRQVFAVTRAHYAHAVFVSVPFQDLHDAIERDLKRRRRNARRKKNKAARLTNNTTVRVDS